MKKINRETAEHYNWKGTCDGWHFVKHFYSFHFSALFLSFRIYKNHFYKSFLSFIPLFTYSSIPIITVPDTRSILCLMVMLIYDSLDLLSKLPDHYNLALRENVAHP